MSGGVDASTARQASIDLSTETFRKLGHELVDSLASLFDTIGERPVTTSLALSDIRARVGQRGLPEQGEDPAVVLQSATELLLDASTFNGHPRFFGYITASAAPIGVLGELLAAGINANVGAWTLSPAATEIERQTVSWVAELLGYPTNCGGLFVSGGNMANMMCLFVARHALSSARRDSGNGSDSDVDFRIYASTETHTWIEKAIDIMGLRSESLRRIPVDARGRLQVDALRRCMSDDRASGGTPLAVIGTAGTTNTGSVDPLAALGALCRREGVWFHVDGAYGAPAAAVFENDEDFQAIGGADSVSVDPHKWLYAPLEAGCALVRDASLLRATFAHHPPYYHFDSAEGEPDFNYLEYGPQNSRGFRALKVWLALRQVGRAGYAKLIADDISLARLLYQTVEANDHLEAVTCELSIVTFAFVPPDLDGAAGHAEYLNALNTELLSTLQQSGSVYLSNAVIDGRFLLRACIVNFRTSASDVVETVDIVVRAGIALDATLRGER